MAFVFWLVAFLAALAAAVLLILGLKMADSAPQEAAAAAVAIAIAAIPYLLARAVDGLRSSY